jgi:hypothetical protein
MKQIRRRFGIAEWYGKPLSVMTPAERRRLAIMLLNKDPKLKAIPCPFRSTELAVVPCTKPGGVCSLRLYEQTSEGVLPVDSSSGQLRATCPNRFQQASTIYDWVSEVVLRSSDASVISEIGFLQRVSNEDSPDQREDNVGRIDEVLLVPGSDPLRWCALEVQAVYFSGPGMSAEFKSLSLSKGARIPFPTAIRRPDYRSSGPKRLMPQLQIKVPTLRRWGKKMAVVVDRAFFDALGRMDSVKDISNADVAWFVVGYDESSVPITLTRDAVCFTTLERAVEGLTGGVPVTQDEFERRIMEKAARSEAPALTKPDLV